MQMSNVVLLFVASGALAANLVLDRVAAAVARAVARWDARRTSRTPRPAACAPPARCC